MFSYQYVDPSLWDDIVSLYFELYQDLFEVDSLSELNPHQSKVLAGLIYGESGSFCKIPKSLTRKSVFRLSKSSVGTGFDLPVCGRASFSLLFGCCSAF